ncbi:MAG: tetratricopeptide repeat protein [Blautia massiliensis (ex Durand et al. 2017)]
MVIFRSKKKKQSDYQNAIAKEEECISEGNYEELDQWYQKAVKIFPGKAEAYVKKAEALNREKDYKKCITFINDNILTNEKVMEDGILDGVYYLLGDSYAQLEEYEKAADSYEYAIKLNPENGSYYRDYAITEAYCGDTQKAQKLLDEAEEKGSSTADIEYVKGRDPVQCWRIQ